MSAAAVGWDHPKTAWYYEAFCTRHSRYREANAALVENAALTPDLTVLDIAAGTGRTAEAALTLLGPHGRIVCFEPAAAMRAAGIERIADSRVSWTATLPDPPDAFDRILCGAAAWQFSSLSATVGRWASLLRPGGALCFNVPSLYFGEPDEPGGGRNPMLLDLAARIADGRTSQADAIEPLPSAAAIDALLIEVGLQPGRWSCRMRFSGEAYRDWMKIPVMTDALLPELTPDERALRIDAAYGSTDAASWRWERWTGWTAWRPRPGGEPRVPHAATP